MGKDFPLPHPTLTSSFNGLSKHFSMDYHIGTKTSFFLFVCLSRKNNLFSKKSLKAIHTMDKNLSLYYYLGPLYKP